MCSEEILIVVQKETYRFLAAFHSEGEIKGFFALDKRFDPADYQIMYCWMADEDPACIKDAKGVIRETGTELP